MSAKDSVSKTISVAGVLCVACSVVVSAAAVLLAPKQDENKLLDKKKNILMAAGMYEDGTDIKETFKKIETRVVDFESGNYAEAPEGYDQKKAAKDPKMSVSVPGDKVAGSGIKQRAKLGYVYLVKNDSGAVEKVILPVHGKGLWSTMYGFLALSSDLKKVDGLTFYEHGETPGLGGEIENPRWLAMWRGKVAFNDNWEPTIEVIKGAVDPNSARAVSQIDGLSGATITSRGVTGTMKYWLSDHGYGKYLTKFREGNI